MVRGKGPGPRKPTKLLEKGINLYLVEEFVTIQ